MTPQFIDDEAEEVSGTDEEPFSDEYCEHCFCEIECCACGGVDYEDDLEI